jgi:hypothetical protein
MDIVVQLKASPIAVPHLGILKVEIRVKVLLEI